MSTFTSQTPTPAAPPDPTKHVNYTYGMVLGVDDFTQEFAYLAGRDQGLAHDLIGYGTVCGLRVSVSTVDPTQPEVVVAAGTAVSPGGQLIRVPLAQCARINDWLTANQADVSTRLGSPPLLPLRLYVVLSYKECLTDPVPIPGEPCRSEDETMAPSRSKDDFQLELLFDPPDQGEEDALRAFVADLSAVQVSDLPGSFVTLDQFLAAVRALGQPASPLPSPLGSPPGSPLGSPLAGLRIHPADVPAFLRAALRVWVIELRPTWLGMRAQADCSLPAEGRLLLAELDVPLAPVGGGGWKVKTPVNIPVNEERRPYLVPLRLLQEWLLYLPPGAGKTAPGTVVAAGQFNADGSPQFSFQGLKATQLGGATGVFYLLEFPLFQPGGNYVVKGTVLAEASIIAQAFQVVPPSDTAGLTPLLKPIGKNPSSGIVVRAAKGATNQPAVFQVEISQF